MTRVTRSVGRTRVVDPGDYVRIVGQSFLRHERQPILAIGNRSWNRWTLGRLGCPHPKAAAALNRMVQQLDIGSLSELATRAAEIGTYKGLGVTAYWTLLAILREAGYDVEAVHHSEVSYATVKARARREYEKAAPRLRKRSHS
jgi:hypothetical protein